MAEHTYLPAPRLTPHSRALIHTHVQGREQGAYPEIQRHLQMDFQFHQTPRSGPACKIPWTKCNFGFQQCWSSDPDGLCIHLLKSYFTVLKLTFSSVINGNFIFLISGLSGTRPSARPLLRMSLCHSPLHLPSLGRAGAYQMPLKTCFRLLPLSR